MGIRLASATSVILNINKINISHKIHFVYLTLTLALLNPSQSKTHYINVVLNIYSKRNRILSGILYTKYYAGYAHNIYVQSSDKLINSSVKSNQICMTFSIHIHSHTIQKKSMNK